MCGLFTGVLLCRVGQTATAVQTHHLHGLEASGGQRRCRSLTHPTRIRACPPKGQAPFETKPKDFYWGGLLINGHANHQFKLTRLCRILAFATRIVDDQQHLFYLTRSIA